MIAKEIPTQMSSFGTFGPMPLARGSQSRTPIVRGPPQVRRHGRIAPRPKVLSTFELRSGRFGRDRERSEAVGFMSLARLELPLDLIRHIMRFAKSFKGVIVDHFRAHTRTVNALAVSQDLRRLASGDDNGVTHVRDTFDFRIIRTFNGPNSSVMSLAFVLGDVAVLYYAGITKVWRLTDGTCHTITRDEEARCLVAFPDGTLVVGYDDGLIVFYRGGNVLANIHTHNAPVVALAIMTDGRLASCSQTGRVCIHASNSHTLLNMADSAWSMCRFGSGIAVGCDSGTIAIIWNDGRMHGLTEDHFFRVTAVCELPDGSLASGSSEGQLHVSGADGPLGLKLIGDINAIVSVPPGDRSLPNGRTKQIPGRVIVASKYDVIIME